MADFTTSLYLGLRHPSHALEPWEDFTTGVPAALGEPSNAGPLAAALASLQGQQRALLERSTLHAFTDCIATLARPGDTGILVDDGAYHVGRAAASGVAARVLVAAAAHYDSGSLAHQLEAPGWVGLRPMLVADGWCTGCGRAAPVAEMLEVLRAHSGLLLLDDTQALGVLGEPRLGYPYGRGGGGTMRHSQAVGSNVILVSSLAKAFGAPLAVIAGQAPLIDGIARDGPARVHNSPPSQADLTAARRALVINSRHGDRLRGRLAALVRAFAEPLTAAGVALAGGTFPVQTVTGLPRRTALDLQLFLQSESIRTVVTRARCAAAVGVTFVITVRNTFAQIEHAAGATINFLLGHHRTAPNAASRYHALDGRTVGRAFG